MQLEHLADCLDTQFADNNQLLDEVFCDIQNDQGRGKGYHPKPKAEVGNPYRDLDFSGYYKNRI